ncbi:hypothetical protein HU200_058334 [Digitaria exilis]|uniref:Exocyst subunit Exo70 family protein n=1 Tax=Digitaria exilis TaxID=1010633 RepID=A0A835E227_9POAL|nr:hypothetical protein HU200_058334 [Digitaria exilis]
MSSIPVEPAMFEDLLLEESESKTKRLKQLVQEFSGLKGGDMSVVRRWLAELGIEWVLLDDPADAAAPAVKPEHTSDARCRSWARALAEIVESIRYTAPLFADPRHGSVTGLSMIREEEAGHVADQGEERLGIFPRRFLSRGLTNKLLQNVVNKLFWSNPESLPHTSSDEEDEESNIPYQLQFARFFQETMLRMLSFVDDTAASEVDVRSSGVQAQYEKLSALLGVRYALSKALPQIRLPSCSPRSARAQVDRVQGDVISLLSAKAGKAGEAAWSTMEEIWTGIKEWLKEEDGDRTAASGTQQSIQRSSDVHKATLSVVTYITFLRANYWTVAPIVSSAACHGEYVYVPRFEDVPPLISLIIEMASCIEDKLAVNSVSLFPDQSLRFLFLLNNAHFIRQHLLCPFYFPVIPEAAVPRRVEGYMESYLKVSCAPVLSCLLDPAPQCFGGPSSPMSKFESEFQKTYSTQKLWKVPDPKLRKKLRKAITEKIISGYTKFIEDNRVTTLRVSPQEIKEMLQELFEG